VDLSHIEVPYEQGWNWQKSLVEHHIKLQQNPGNVIGHVLLLQHKSVFTLGSATNVYIIFSSFNLSYRHKFRN
jgi:lipoate-protein ligase B